MALRRGAFIVFLECRASRPTRAGRLESRGAGEGLSDARREHLDVLLRRLGGAH
jgi:hypothetical protein